ncbi:MAG: hypothetical protein HY435_01845 [Candidatus Liptonbacteria bacterium]|nr:hypothetical protein [Candidatus Liptonbacteria bacterium]
MTYDIYFHDDFDGRASAAVMRVFLEARGDSVERYVPLNFDVKEKWHAFKFPRPAVLLDFIYHPKTTWWFDHHLTTFIKPEWKRNFRGTRYHFWDPSAPSCCGQVIKALARHHGFKPAKHLKELSIWLDVIDSAAFKSARQTVEMKEPALKVTAFIDHESNKKKPLEWLIKLMGEKSLREIARDARVQELLKDSEKMKKEALRYYETHIEIFGKVGVMDSFPRNVMVVRFAPYYLYPRLIYNISVYPSGPRHFRLKVGVNPWRRREAKKLHIGNYLAKYGGGGHRYVGGAEIKGRKEIMRIVAEIRNALNG